MHRTALALYLCIIIKLFFETRKIKDHEPF